MRPRTLAESASARERFLTPRLLRDWLELNSRPAPNTQEIAQADAEVENGGGDR